jgi:hypothetical protein
MDNTDLKILVEHLTRLEEGEIGRKIGSAIGGIFGKDAGDRLGQIGSNIGDIFDPATKSVITPNPDAIKSAQATTSVVSKPGSSGSGADKPGSSGSSGSSEPSDKSWQVKAEPNAATSADVKYFMKNPDGSTSEVTPPPNGWGSNRDATNPKTGEKMDKYGNSPGDYTKIDDVAVSAGYGGKQTRGGLEAEIQKLENERGTGLKVVDAWNWKNSVLVLLDGDRTKADTARGTTIGIYTEFGSNAMAGGNEFAPFYERMGYKDFQGDTEIRTMGPFGNAYGALHKMKRPDGKAIVICELYQYYTFQSQKGKGLHMYTVTFLGPEEDWVNGGREELRKLHDSIKLSSNVKPLAPPTMQEQIRHLQNKLDYLEKN